MKIFLYFFCLCLPLSLVGQNDFLHVGSDVKEPSAIVQFDATDKGILIPRMTEEERLEIQYVDDVSEGLLVFDEESDSFWYYDGSKWVEFDSVRINVIEDGDTDTKVWTEKNGDEDVLRFDVGGQEKVILNDAIFKVVEDSDLLVGNSLFGVGKKTFYDSSKEAFRHGDVDATEWDDFIRGQNSFAFGKNTIASGEFSAAWGRGNLATADYSTAFGSFTDATAEYATSWGLGSQATGLHSVAGGSNCNATNSYATSLGNNNTASGNGSTAFGFSTLAAGAYSTTFGALTEANGSNSVAMGLNSVAEGKNSTAIGTDAVAESFAETAFGRFNTKYTPNSKIAINSNDRLFVVGNGTSEANRKDAFSIQKNGSVTAAGPIVNYPLPGEVDTKFKLLNVDGADEKGWGFRHLDLFEQFFIERYDGGSEIAAMTWESDGRLRLGTSCCGTLLSVGGNASKNTSGAWLANSDSRLKKEIETIDSVYALAQLLKMQGVHYEWNSDMEDVARPLGKQDGFIAQDLKEVWPEKIKEDDRGFLLTAYGDFDPMFVESFKAQQTIIQSLQDEQVFLGSMLTEQTNRNDEIKIRLNELKVQVAIVLEQIHVEELSTETSSTIDHLKNQK